MFEIIIINASENHAIATTNCYAYAVLIATTLSERPTNKEVYGVRNTETGEVVNQYKPLN